MKITYRKDVNIYEHPQTGTWYATYRVQVNDPMRGVVKVQRNFATPFKGKSRQPLAQRWANEKRDKDIGDFLSGKQAKVLNRRAGKYAGGVTCGDVIDCYLEHCQQVSAKNVIKAFCVLVAESRDQLDLKPEEREAFVRPIQLSTLSADHLNDWRDQNLLGRRTPNNIHAIMRTARGIFATRVCNNYYRKLPSFGRDYPVNIKEWKCVTKPSVGEGEDKRFQVIDPVKLARMDKAANIANPQRSHILRLARWHGRLGNESRSIRWRNVFVSYALMRYRGLRNNEVEGLRWEWFRVASDNVQIGIIKRPYWKGPKNKLGAHRLVDPRLYNAFLEVFGPRQEGPQGFVLLGDEHDRKTGCNEYANKFFRHYVDDAWREKGSYELRKQFGSEIAATRGLAEAAYELRDTGLETVFRHYFDLIRKVEPSITLASLKR